MYGPYSLFGLRRRHEELEQEDPHRLLPSSEWLARQGQIEKPDPESQMMLESGGLWKCWEQVYPGAFPSLFL